MRAGRIRSRTPNRVLLARARIRDLRMKTHQDRTDGLGACRGCPLKSRAICRAVHAKAPLGGRGMHRLRTLGPDWVLQEEGDAPKLTGILRRGYLRTERMLEDGRRCVVGLAVPGDPVGAWTETAASCTIAAATEVEICTFDTTALRRVLADDPTLRMEILYAMAEQHARQLDLVWRRGALTSRERIIAFLVMAADIMPSEALPDGGIVVTVPVSRRDWADITNTTVETICRTLGQLADQGAIQSLSQGRYIIPDLAVLAELAGLDPDLDRMAQRPRPAHPKRHELSLGDWPQPHAMARQVATMGGVHLHRASGTPTAAP